MKYPYNPLLKELARQLRKNSTVAEALLWKELKGRQLGVDFHRQKPIDEFIVDFFSPSLGLAIEVDGISHDFRSVDDERKTAALTRLGITILRFGDREVKANCLGVVAEILRWVNEHNPAATGDQ
jgi:very-short-patch-repair endonuclease